MRSAINILKLVVAAATLLLASGCATQATLTILSEPTGAFITEIETGKSFGMAPVAVVYDSATLRRYKDASGCFAVKGFEARWVSGASASLNPIRGCASTSGSYTITLSRDPSKPGLEQDMEFAIKAKSLQIQQQQANAVSNAANDAALFSAWSNMQQNNINCTSTAIGNSVKTNCR